jgi:hypothetical protein
MTKQLQARLAQSRTAKALAVAVISTPLLANAQATGVDFSSLTTGIAFTGVVTGILAVAAVKVLPLVAKWGAGKILAMVGR